MITKSSLVGLKSTKSTNQHAAGFNRIQKLPYKIATGVFSLSRSYWHCGFRCSAATVFLVVDSGLAAFGTGVARRHQTWP